MFHIPWKQLLAAIALFIGSFALTGVMTGCEDDDGAFEEAGEDVDEAVEETKDAMDDAGDEIEDATDD